MHQIIIHLVITIVGAFSAAASFSQSANKPSIERVGGDFKITKIENLKSGFQIRFTSAAPIKIQNILLVSDHVHSGMKEGDTIRISADLHKIEGNTGYASQVLLFMPSSQGNIPVWMTARDSKLDIKQDFLKMHAPSNDYLVL